MENEICPKPKPNLVFRAKGIRSSNSQEMKYSFKLEGELNISAFVARREVNGYLIRRVPHLVTSGDPVLEMRSEGAFWIVPVVLTMPGIGRVGQIGQIVVDAQLGNILEEESTPFEEIEKNADRLAEEKAL